MDGEKIIKICHVTSVHNNDDVRIFQKECMSLAKNPNYKVYIVAKGESFDSNNVHVVGIGEAPNSRLKRMFSFSKKIYRQSLEIDADIYHLHDPELLKYAIKLKRQGKKVIFDSHENVVEQIKDKTWIPKCFRNLISQLFSMIFIHVGKRMDYIIGVTPQQVDILKSINEKSIMITNYPLLKESHEAPVFSENNICFAGGISSQWNHDSVIKAIGNMNNVKYYLAGSGEDSYIQDLKSLDGWERVVYMGKIPFDQVGELYRKSYVGVALNYSKQAFPVGTLGNTKLFEYMEAGLPLICSNYTLWKEIVKKWDCGICVNPLDYNDVQNALIYLFENPEKAKQMGENGRNAALKEYNWNVEEKKLFQLYFELEG